MTTNILPKTLFFITLIFTGLVNAQANEMLCMDIGGLGMPNFVPQSDGTITIVAPLSGSLATASGKITAQRKTKAGLEMDMEHYFMNKKGGFMNTKDLGILTRVEGKENHYMMEITLSCANRINFRCTEGIQRKLQKLRTSRFGKYARTNPI